MPVIAGTGSNSTSEAIELTRAAKEAGVDASLQVCPYYNKPTQEGLYNHFKAVADAVDLPMILYNIPGRASRNIEPDTIIRLWNDVPQVVGLKDASGDLHQAMVVLRATERDTFQVYSGEDIMTFSLLCHGAAGAIAAVAHVVGREVAAMCHAVWAGDLDGGPATPFPHHAGSGRLVRRAEPHSREAGGGVDGTSGWTVAPSAGAHVRAGAGDPERSDAVRRVALRAEVNAPRGRPGASGRSCTLGISFVNVWTSSPPWCRLCIIPIGVWVS